MPILLPNESDPTESGKRDTGISPHIPKVPKVPKVPQQPPQPKQSPKPEAPTHTQIPEPLF